MKRFFLALGLFVVFAASASANVEFDGNLVLNKHFVNPFDTEHDFLLGAGGNAIFYFGKPEGKFDIGLALFGGVTHYEEDERHTTYPALYSPNVIRDERYEFDGYNWWLGLGPAFRYSFNKTFSLFVRPGVFLNVQFFSLEERDTYAWRYNDTIHFFRVNASDDSLVAYNAGFDIDLGGRVWFLHTDSFHLGLDFGADLAIMTDGRYQHDSVADKYKVDDRFQPKFYVGVCINLGDRGVDK